jgi:3-deoxy-7-phosphoheptulonate synthase
VRQPEVPPRGHRVDFSGRKIGGGNFQINRVQIGGEPGIRSWKCQRVQTPARGSRGGAFKPRTSPYAFQGLHRRA